MELFKTLFNPKKSKVFPEPLAESYEAFEAAGFVFTNGRVVLAGYQPYKRKPIITGLGGCRKTGETSFQTALRETLEELFGFNTLNLTQIKPILERFPAKNKRQNGNYIFYIYSFEELVRLLKLSKQYIKTVPLYVSIPYTLQELLTQRGARIDINIDYKPEVSHLCILPVVNGPITRLIIDDYFVKDMNLFTK